MLNRQKHVTGFDRHEEEGEAQANKKNMAQVCLFLLGELTLGIRMNMGCIMTMQEGGLSKNQACLLLLLSLVDKNLVIAETILRFSTI